MKPVILKPIYRSVPEAYKADVQRIIQAFADEGYECSPEMAVHLWGVHSDRMSAGWLILPKTNEGIFARLAGYVELG